jgi:hypothetical protein
MQSMPPIASSHADCYLQIRRGKQTIFTDVSEATTVSELKHVVAQILKVSPEIIRIKSKIQVLDVDDRRVVEYGITTKDARPQTPFQLECILQLDDGTYETEDIVPYTSESNASNPEHPSMGVSVDSR